MLSAKRNTVQQVADQTIQTSRHISRDIMTPLRRVVGAIDFRPWSAKKAWVSEIRTVASGFRASMVGW